MTTGTDDRLRSHLRTLADLPVGSPDEIERDVLDRVTHRRRRRRQRVALGGVAAIVVVSVTVVSLLAGNSDSPNVKTIGEPPDGSQEEGSRGQTELNMVEIQRFYPDPTERVTIEFDAPLPDDAVTQVDEIADVDVPGIAVVLQETSAWTVCGTRHWAVESPLAHVTILFPASWFEHPESAGDTPIRWPGYEFDPPVLFPGYEDEGPSQQGTKVWTCGPYKGYVQVAILAAQSDDVEVSIDESPPQVVVEVH